jgi:hypothetical protein
MRKKQCAFWAFLALTLMSASVYAETAHVKSMDAVDFLVDRASFLGRRVTVTGCQIVFANANQVQCRVNNGGSSSFYVDAKSLDRESLRRALKVCTGYEARRECEADITGVVVKVLNDPGLKDATFKWRSD